MFNHKKDKKLLYSLTALGIALLPTLLRKNVKDSFLIFFFKGYLSSFIDSFVMKNHNRVRYPVRLFPKIFHINVLYDLLLLPISCVWYNQLTQNSSLKGIIGKVFFFSVPMTIIETIAEKKTRLLKYNNWTWFHTLITLTLTFWTGRIFIGGIRKLDHWKKKRFKQKQHEDSYS